MRGAKQIQLTSLRSSLLSEVTDVSFVPRKLIAHRHFVQRTLTRSMRQVRLSISHPAQCEHRGWLVKYRHFTQNPTKGIVERKRHFNSYGFIVAALQDECGHVVMNGFQRASWA
jgi:hypothetical protein